MKTRILFVAENVTLAQVVRLAVLARALPRERYEVHFASSSFDPLVFDGLDVHQHTLHTIEKKAVEKALAAGKRIYEKKTLLSYVRADLSVIESVRPSLIVGDFRLSLSISAPVSRVPHATLVNAYWSPFRAETSFPVPDHPIIRMLGEELTAQYFPQAIPGVFRHFAAPVNAVRRRYGLKPIGSLQEVLVHGDYTLYADTPGLVPSKSLPSRHGYLGPVLWAPPATSAAELLRPSDLRPLVYVTLGSSGKAEVLPCIIEALANLPVKVVVATAGRASVPTLPANVVAADFVPGDVLAQHASLVVSNGGSTTGYQAISQGTPVLGVPSNLDQFLATQAIDRFGAGLSVKARSITATQIQSAVQKLLSEPTYTERARMAAREFDAYPAELRFTNFVDGVVHALGSSTASALA